MANASFNRMGHAPRVANPARSNSPPALADVDATRRGLSTPLHFASGGRTQAMVVPAILEK
jgi:hypothetical protein